MQNQEIGSSSSISEWDDDSLTNEQLEAIDAIEATFHQSKRRSPFQNHNNCLTRRRLPHSVSSLSSPFSLSPCPRNLKMKYPAMKFVGEICYSRTKDEVEKASKELLNIIQFKRDQNCDVALGFDIEWKPTFRKGVSPGKAAVMQLCIGADHCNVVHIIHSGITESLQFLLEDSTLPKVGVGIGNDSIKVFKDYNVSVKAVEDLSRLARKKNIGGEPKSWGLGSLIEMLFCKELKKPHKLRMGNWERGILSKEQLHYAATDAFASWQLYQVLRSLPDEDDATHETSAEVEVAP